MDEVQAIGQIVDRLSVAAVLGIVAWAFVTGKVPTRAELDQSKATNQQQRDDFERTIALIKEAHQSEIRRLEASEQRAWQQATQAKDELRANNQVLERQADAMGHLREAVTSFARGRGL